MEASGELAELLGMSAAQDAPETETVVGGGTSLNGGQALQIENRLGWLTGADLPPSPRIFA